MIVTPGAAKRTTVVLRNVAAQILALVSMHLHEADSSMVVDGYVRELPAGATDRVALITGDAVTRADDAAKVFTQSSCL